MTLVSEASFTERRFTGGDGTRLLVSKRGERRVIHLEGPGPGLAGPALVGEICPASRMLLTYRTRKGATHYSFSTLLLLDATAFDTVRIIDATGSFRLTKSWLLANGLDEARRHLVKTFRPEGFAHTIRVSLESIEPFRDVAPVLH